MKRKISALLAGVTLFSLMGGFWLSNAAETVSLSDIGGTTYENAITFLVGEGVVEGYPDGTYKPNQTINRAELLKIILEASDADMSGAATSCFPDVSGDDWYVKYVCTAKALGIVEGYPDGTFKPALTVNFVEALKIIELGYDLEAGAVSDPWYKRYVDTASGYNMIPHEILAFGAGLTRGQMADMITRLNKYQDGTQEAYLLESYGENGDTVVTYEIIKEREASLTTVAPAKLSSSVIDTFSSDIPVLKTMNFSASINETQTSVASASNYDEVMNFLEVDLSAERKALLEQNKFVLVPLEDTKFNDFNYYTEYDEMLGVLDEIGGRYNEMDREPQNAKLITTDAVLHAFHKYFENTLEKLEKEELGAKLRTFAENLQARALACMDGSLDTTVAFRCENIAAQITVARALVENAQWEKPDYFDTTEAQFNWNEEDKTIDGIANAKAWLETYRSRFSTELYSAMEQELTDIYAASDLGKSPLFGQYYKDLITDYTQFTPRSHYTKTSSLRAYFRAMMYLGRSTYIFGEEVGVQDTLILSWLMSDPSVLEPWNEIMKITGFYAGQADDVIYSVWRDYVVDTLGDIEISATVAVDQAKIDALIMNLNELEPPKILSDAIVSEEVFGMTKEDLLNATKGFRIFGQRFTYDAWILNSLTAGDEISEVNLPSTPSALFVNAAFGDETAKAFSGDVLMQDFGFASAEIEAFNGKLDEIAADIAAVTDDSWFMSMGSAWLELLGTLTGEYGDGYPLFMQSQAYMEKQIQTFLGSYTELKHDTLLYAKQSYAEMGAGFDEGDIPPVVKGFVEPNMEFWYKLQRLVTFTRQGFEANDLLSDQIYKLEKLEEAVDFYAMIAEKELKGEQITDEEYEKLRTEDLEWIAAPMEDMGDVMMDEEEKRAAMIADIHTDVLKSQILYEAVGRPYVMIAYVANEGSPRLTTGLTFNHYETTGPLGGERYTDESWEEWVYTDSSKMPEKNFWYNHLLAD